MTNVILFDDKTVRDNLLPFTYTRPVALIRVGITNLASKWKALIGDARLSYLTSCDYLSAKYSCSVARDNLFVAGHVIPSAAMVKAVMQLQPGQALKADAELIAFRGALSEFQAGKFSSAVQCQQQFLAIRHLYDIFELNAQALEQDFRILTAGRKSAPLSPSNRIIGDLQFPDGKPKIFVEPGAYVEGACINVNAGPVYIGKNVEIMEGACIRAPFAACHDAKVRMCAKIYGATTLGPFCKVGGELENSVMFGFSNKAHDGYIGDAVIGEWCNIGGGTTASNLKNDYGEIRVWNYPAQRFLKTGRQFCGLFMGDHSKTGVNCMINTGTVLGVGVNIHGAGFPRNFVPSFSEGGSTSGFKDVSLATFFSIAERVMQRRGVTLSDDDKRIFTAIYNQADNYK